MGNADDGTGLSVAALGRPFRLGMLYDSRTEKLIPGITLWDQTTLEKRTVQLLETSNFHVICADSLDDKASALEVDAALKLSFLSGLVDVQGAAKYLYNKKSSKHQERVTLQYYCTTREESMTMDQLGTGRVQHPDVFDHGTATHVVTSIVFGAQAYFVFERVHSSKDHDQNVEGNVHAIIKNIPGITIDGKGELDWSKDEKKKTENISCIFYGDFLLRQNPSCFSDAVKLYQELPKLLGTGGEKAVPVKVYLHPLTLIDRRATRLIREISIERISETERYFEDMHELSIKCKDILKSYAVKSFLAIQNQMQEFITLTETYKRVIQKELCVMLPEIRGGGKEERCLIDLLNKISQSPFSIPALRSWLQTKDTQIKVLNQYVQAVADIKFVKDAGDLESVVLSPENTYSLCLCISMPANNSQLEKMKHCFGNRSSNSCEESGDMVTTQQISNTNMMEVARGFKHFYIANKTKEEVFFCMAQEFSETDAFHAKVKCYNYGKLISNHYELPSAPEKVAALVQDTTHESVTISWSPPKYGASVITDIIYVVSCRQDVSEQVTSRDSVECEVTIPSLAANTEYEVQVWTRCEVGEGPVGDAKITVKTRPASPPKMLRALKESPKKVLLKWQAPTCVANGCHVEEYIIKQETKADHWEEICRSASSTLSCSVEISPNTVPNFRVVASCGSAGLSCDSVCCTIDLTKATTPKALKHNIRACSILAPNNSQIYIPEMKLVASDSSGMIEKYEFGERKFGVQEKVLMLVGATGSGKTTLINGFVNYVLGVEWKDSYRFKMIMEPNAANQAMSQTTKITSYTLHHQEGFRVPFSLTIVDTPGFGDVTGIMQDKEITENIRNFFTTRGKNGISHIDGVGIVVNSSLPRLNPTQMYIFCQILSLFGKDVADNVFHLLTFVDGKKSQVLSGIKEAKISDKKYFKFNNSALYAFQNEGCGSKDSDSDDEGDGSLDSMFWEMGVKSFNQFLEQLRLAESKSLILTQDVLNERNRLQTYIVGIQRDIREGLGILEWLKKEKEILQSHHADIERNKNFEYEVKGERDIVKVSTPAGMHVTNCLQCNRTCHELCSEGLHARRCYAMSNGYCRIGPNNCSWDTHKSYSKCESELKKITGPNKELRQRYEKATQGKLIAENLIEKANEKFEALKFKVLGVTHSVRMSLQRLQKIALRPNPMTTVQFYDVLIEAEKSQADPGWQARLEQLKTVKKEAEYMEMIADQDFDPFKKYAE